MVTILFVSHSGNMLGAEKALWILASGLDHRRFRTVVVVPADGRLAAELRKKAIPVHILPRKFAGIGWRVLKSLPIGDKIRYLLESLGYTVRLIQIIHKERTNVVHINTVMEIFAGIAARLTQRAVLWHVHESPSSPVLGMLSKIIWTLSDCIVVNSNATLDAMMWREERATESDKLHLVYYGIDLTAYNRDLSGRNIRHEFDIEDNTPVIGLVGHLAHRKGIDVFVRAATLIHNYFPDARFLLVGSFTDKEYESRIRQMIEEGGTGSIIRFTGFRTDIPDVMAGLDILVVPSRTEPFGMVVIEGMAAGKPVVASHVGGIPEIIVHGETGLLVTPDQPDELARAVCGLLHDSQTRADMGHKACQQVKNLFAEDKFVSIMEAIYNNVA